MIPLFTEGFGAVRSITDVARVFPEANTGTPISVIGRNGLRCLRVENGTATFRTAPITHSVSTIQMGMAVRVHNCANAWKQISILNSSNAEQLSIMTIAVTGTVRFRLMRGSTELFLSVALPMDVFHYIELEALIDDEAGTWVFRINEMTVGKGEGDTSESGTPSFSKVLFNLSTVAGVGNFIDIQDFYVSEPPGKLLGDVVMENLVPISDGHLSEWELIALPHFSLLDDAISGGVDDDTTYIASAIEEPSDFFVMQKAQVARQAPINVKLYVDAKKIGVPVERVIGLFPGTINYYLPITTSYARYLWNIGPMTPEDIDATEAGIRRIEIA